MTFDEAIHAKTLEERQHEELQRSLQPTIEALHALRKEIAKHYPAWHQRWDAINARRQAALQKHVRHPDLEWISEQLWGGLSGGGLLSLIHSDLDGTLSNLEHFPKSAVWNPDPMLYREPDRFRTNIGAIDQYLTRAERLVRDGGELMQMVLDRAGQPEPVTMPPEPVRQQEPVVET
jgi:hypothetical protein